MDVKLRKWATPLVVGMFLLVGVSGVLMFFHLDINYVKLAHEWLGLVMIVGGLAHLVLNWKAFTCYIRRPLAVSIMALSAVILGLSFLPLGGLNKGGPEATIEITMHALDKAPLHLLAKLGQKTPDSLASSLFDAGYTTDRDINRTLGELSDGNRAKKMQIISVALKPNEDGN